MTNLSIRADGSIVRGTTAVDARINGTSPRELRIGDRHWDVTHVWHSAALAEIVEALMAGTDLPTGFHLRARKDGMAMVGTDRA